MSVFVQTERFEGPLELLLHLIRKEEMDIFDINIFEITQQYLDFVKAMKQIDLELAGDFVAMAATLIQIKARMLLPQYNEEGEVVESEDPRKELVQRLLEYQKFQEAAETLYARPLVGRDTWLRGFREKLDEEDLEQSDLILEDNPLFSLISAYRVAVKKMKKAIHKVQSDLQSVAARIAEIKYRLVVGARVGLQDIVTETTEKRDHLLITFLSLLELAKMGFVSLFQTEPGEELFVTAKKPIDESALSQVENYDSQFAEETAQLLLEADDLLDDSQDEPAPEREVTLLQDHILDGRPSEFEGEVEAATDEEILAEEQRLGNVEETL